MLDTSSPVFPPHAPRWTAVVAMGSFLPATQVCTYECLGQGHVGTPSCTYELIVVSHKGSTRSIDCSRVDLDTERKSKALIPGSTRRSTVNLYQLMFLWTLAPMGYKYVTHINPGYVLL